MEIDQNDEILAERSENPARVQLEICIYEQVCGSKRKNGIDFLESP